MSDIPSEVVCRYAYKHNLDLVAAEDLFGELEAFLDTATGSFASPTPRVDEAWHEFILHTRLYAEYCQARYGTFVHHIPLSPLAFEGDPKGTGKCKKACGTGVQSGGDELIVMPMGHRCSTDCRRSHPGEEVNA